MRKCVICGEEKELEMFRKRQIWFSHTCKLCYTTRYRSGKPNKGRFEKNCIPWIKGKKGVKKRETPRYIKKGRPVKNIPALRIKWAMEVKKRDGLKCQHCGSQNNLHAHHIVKWKLDEKLRFDLDNGITLCCPCHARTERLIELSQGQNNLKRIKNGYNYKSI